MKALFLVLFIVAFSVTSSAQTHASYSESTIVKDSTGFVFKYNLWEPLVKKGTHMLIPENPEDKATAYFIVRVTPEQLAAKERMKEARISKLPKPSPSDYFKDGQEIKLYDLKDLDGNPLDLSKAKGKIIVMNFWFVNCPPCREEIPDLNNLVEKYKSNPNVIFVAVALDKKRKIQDFLSKNPFIYKIVEDGRMIAGSYGIEAYPTHVVVDENGKVYFHTMGLAENTIYWLKKSIGELVERQAKATASN